MNVMSPRGAVGGIVAGDFSDPTNERLIYLSAAGLAVVGLALLFGTLLWWRRGRQEHPALAPLEVMSGRSWEKAPEGDRRRRLEHVRLAGSAGSVDERATSEPVDLEALVRSVPQAFDDLKEPSAVVVAADAVAEPESEPAVDSEEVVAEPVENVPDAEPVAVEPVDATSISTERPAAPPESPLVTPKEPEK